MLAVGVADEVVAAAVAVAVDESFPVVLDGRADAAEGAVQASSGLAAYSAPCVDSLAWHAADAFAVAVAAVPQSDPQLAGHEPLIALLSIAAGVAAAAAAGHVEDCTPEDGVHEDDQHRGLAGEHLLASDSGVGVGEAERYPSVYWVPMNESDG